MEIKKSKNKNLENKRFLFLQIGMIIALSLVFFAFEWKTSFPIPKPEKKDIGIVYVEEIVPITKTKEVVKPKPKFTKSEKFEIVKEIENLVQEVDTATTKTPAVTDSLVDLAVKDETDSVEFIPFVLVEDKPLFPGGDEALLKYISKNIKYPKECKRNHIEGIVGVSYIVDVTGEVIDVKIERSVNYAMDKEVVRVIESLPNYTPGKQRGKPVKVQFKIPIKFSLH